MDVMDCIRARRSIRRFRPDPIPEEVLQEVLEAGRLAPAGGGGDHWWFGVISDQALKDRLAQAAGDQEWIASAPVVIALCGRIDDALNFDGFAGTVNAARFGREFMAYCTQCPDQRNMAKLWANGGPFLPGVQMNLAAVRFGLGACWIGYLDTDEASRLLGLPEHVVCLFLLPIGYPEEAPGPAPRKPLPEVVFRDRWGERDGGS